MPYPSPGADTQSSVAAMGMRGGSKQTVYKAENPSLYADVMSFPPRFGGRFWFPRVGPLYPMLIIFNS